MRFHLLFRRAAAWSGVPVRGTVTFKPKPVAIPDRHFLMMGVLALLAAGCTISDPKPVPWPDQADSTGVRAITESPSLCRECIVLDPLITIGDTAGPGYIEETSDVVRDSAGNYWVGQRRMIKVFDSTGTFLRQVGRAGAGPMEFERPRPVHTDATGRVHIFDRNGRETIVGADFALYEERELPGLVQAAFPLQDAHRYVASMWLGTPDRIGFPLHIIDGSAVMRSFGLRGDQSDGQLSQFNSQRVLTVDAQSHIFSTRLYHYVIEAWTTTGNRIVGFEGPELNQTEPLPGRFAPDNPPPNRIFAIRVDDAARLWVISWQRRPDWQDAVIDQVQPNGEVISLPKDGDFSYDRLYTSRLDVIDLNAASLIARVNQDNLFVGFIGSVSILEAEYLDDGTPRLVVWDAAIVNAGSS
ncbi:MAG: hypothetical protein ACREL7_06200 [Longimicrobiales bacterium]